jgi:hypothetical protein
MPVGPRQREFDHEAQPDETDQRRDHRLELAAAFLLERQQREGADSRHQHADRQRYAE